MEVEEQLVDEVNLDDWFDEEDLDDGEEDQSVDDETPEAEDGTSEAEDEVEVPDAEDQSEADDEPADDGSQAKSKKKGDYDWIDQIPPRLRKEAEALVNRSKSNSGRAAALQARLDEMAARQEAAQLSGQGRTEVPADGAVQVEDLNDEELEAFKKQFPAVAANVDKIIQQRLAKEREEYRKELRPIQEATTTRQILEQKERLRQGVREIFHTAETGIELEDILKGEQWQEWLQAKPKAYQEMVKHADDADTALSVMQDFERYARDSFVEANPPSEPKDTSPSKADLVQKRRKQALDGATPPSHSAEIDDGKSGGYASLFNEAAAKVKMRGR